MFALWKNAYRMIQGTERQRKQKIKRYADTLVLLVFGRWVTFCDVIMCWNA